MMAINDGIFGKYHVNGKNILELNMDGVWGGGGDIMKKGERESEKEVEGGGGGGAKVGRGMEGGGEVQGAD